MLKQLAPGVLCDLLVPLTVRDARALGAVPDLVVERVVVEYMRRSRFCTELQILSGLERGMVTQVIEGKDVGTIISRG